MYKIKQILNHNYYCINIIYSYSIEMSDSDCYAPGKLGDQVSETGCRCTEIYSALCISRHLTASRQTLLAKSRFSLAGN